MYWECSSRGTSRGRCPATVVERQGAFRRGPSDHCHAPTVGVHSSVALAADVRQKARGDMFTSASAIVASAMTGVDIVSGPHDRRPNLNSMVGQIYTL